MEEEKQRRNEEMRRREEYTGPIAVIGKWSNVTRLSSDEKGGERQRCQGIKINRRRRYCDLSHYIWEAGG